MTLYICLLILLQAGCMFAIDDTCVDVHQNNRALTGSVFLKLAPLGYLQCIKQCSYYSLCLSVNFDFDSLTCSLNSNSSSAGNTQLQESPNTAFRDMTTGDQNILCQNAGCPANTRCVILKLGTATCVEFVASTGCLYDSDCSSVTAAVCLNFICACPSNYQLLAARNLCTLDCKSLYSAGHTSNGVFTIRPDGINSVSTFCDMTNGGWTLFQRRTVGDVAFNLNWADYRLFFGSSSGDFWLGLEYIHDLTQMDSDIYFEFTTTADVPFFALYHNFTVGNENSQYLLSVSSDFSISSGYENVIRGGFSDHDNMRFSTVDRDNDASSSDCASSRSAWWWNKCYTFGMFLNDFNDMRIWVEEPDTYLYFKATTMKVRRTV